MIRKLIEKIKRFFIKDKRDEHEIHLGIGGKQ